MEPEITEHLRGAQKGQCSVLLDYPHPHRECCFWLFMCEICLIIKLLNYTIIHKGTMKGTVQ